MRALWRAAVFLAQCAGMLADFHIRRVAAHGLPARALWLHRWTARMARMLGMRLSVTGTPAECGIITSNHLGYLDIIAFSSTSPCVFVSKKEVAGWPVVGPLTSLAGTLFIDRSKRGDVARIAGEISAAVAQGVSLVIFPEGTSTDGSQVLPFKPSLLEPAVQCGCPVTPAAVSYELPGGSVGTELCYWGGMTLLPHLFHVFGLGGFDARIQFGASRHRIIDRKTAAREMHDEVVALLTAG